jgi:4'-phosphopantetheinyl transferase
MFQSNPRGKPYLAGPDADRLYFNLSHSGELALMVVSCQPQAGIDLEYIRPLDNLTSLSHRCFSEYENQQIDSLPASEKQTAFFNTWTRKEAFIKALGDGLSYPLDQFEVSLLPGEPTRLVHIAGSKSEARNWTLQEVRPAPGYAGAYAVRQTGVNTQFRQWVWDED